MDYRSITYILLISVLGVALFGFGAMAIDSDQHNGHLSCIAMAVLGETCPGNFSVLGFLNFHVHAFSAFGLAIFQASVLTLLALLFIVSILFVEFLSAYRELSPVSLSAVGIALTTEFVPLATSQNLIRWLSLHEKRDPSAI